MLKSRRFSLFDKVTYFACLFLICTAQSALAAVDPLALPRGTVDVRVEPGGADHGASWKETQAPVFVNIPKMSATFVASEDKTNLAITFSAEAQTSANNKRMFVRALVDGQVASPGDVVFTQGSFIGARSFIFTDSVDRGVHTVEMQWLVDPGATASVRNAGVLLRHGTGSSPGNTVTLRTPPSGTDQTLVQAWKPVPGTTISFYSQAGVEAVVNFSAEAFVVGANKRLFIRALIDGAPLSPGDVIFAQRASLQSHRMSFGSRPLTGGWHTASIEWLVDAGGTATLGDRSVVVTAFTQGSNLRHDIVVPPSGPPVSTNSGVWVPVPNLSALTPIPKNGEVAVSFSGEVRTSTQAQLEMRLVVNGTPSNETAVLALLGGPYETQSFTFDVKHVFSQASLIGLQLEWRAIGGTIFMGDRAMELVIEPGLVPDLAEAPELGLGNDEFPNGAPIEAAIGQRRLLTIIHKIPRVAPNNIIPTVDAVTDSLFGSTSAADYYDKISGGRFGLINAGVLEYDSLKSESHYWDHDSFDCGQPMADGFAGGHAERWAEAITLASADIDFASFDRDQDGIVQQNELAILIVCPQATPNGFTRNLEPYCNGAPFEVDGVQIPQISEWFTSSATQWEIAAHELAHLILGLGDLYANNFNFNTEVGKLSLMGDNFFNTTHLDPVNKLALGWLTPYYAQFDGTATIHDVKVSESVVVLPRDQNGDGKEFFILENRIDTFNDPLYDSATGLQGIIVWHSVESPTQSANPPACTPMATWNTVTGNGRRGIRVLRPGISFASSLPSSWDSGDYDLLDNGLACPGVMPVKNALLWADGSASGWKVTNFSAAGPVMDFFVDKP